MREHSFRLEKPVSTLNSMEPHSLEPNVPEPISASKLRRCKYLPVSTRLNEFVPKFSSGLSAVHQPYAGSNGVVIRDTRGLHNVGYIVGITLA
jgi:hypothetical protein